MISRALFISVAESIVILAHIDQVGCFNADSLVAFSIISLVAVRNGPPDAVRTILRISLGAPQRADWNTAQCSLSIGRMVAPDCFAAASISGPAMTSGSLF